MKDLLRFPLASLIYYWQRSLLLTFCIALAVFVPLTPIWLVQQISESLESRAKSTPLILATSGSKTDLALTALYFDGRMSPVMKMGEVMAVDENLATAIPLHLRFTTAGATIVGTSDDYYPARKLILKDGKWHQKYGDCVVGASAAKTLQVSPGDYLTTDPKTIFNLSADYPLRIRVTGVIQESGSPDDDVVFVSLDTAWIMEGIGHGHFEKTVQSGQAYGLAPSADQAASETTSEKMHLEITDANIKTFHFHGRRSTYPITACIIIPKDIRAETLLLGQYASLNDKNLMMVQPLAVIRRLLDSVLRVRNLVIAGLALVTGACLILAVLIFWLSFRLRRPEFESLKKIGASTTWVMGICCCEIGLVLMMGGALGTSLALVTSWANQDILRWII